jgi:outer membrane protein assembly factor BamB
MRGCEATIAGGAVYQRSDDGLHAFDLESGRELWTTSGSRVITRVGDRVYVDRGETVAVLAAGTGAELASFPGFGLSMPTVQGGGMLIASDGTNLFAIE